MSISPILSALRRHKAGVVLIGLQIALTLAIVCNAVFIIGERIERMNRPTGVVERDLFLIQQAWVNAPNEELAGSAQKLGAMQQEDLAALRQLADVESVAPTTSMPLLDSSWNEGIRLDPEQPQQTARVSYYLGDEQLLPTLGLRLVAGRAFTNADILHQGLRDIRQPPVVIVTKTIADLLFPHGDAVGKVIYLAGTRKPITIIGVVERLQVPGINRWTATFAYNSVLLPIQREGFFAFYAVRAKPGRLQSAMRAAPAALYQANPLRVFADSTTPAQSFAAIRARAYRDDIGMAILMGAVCVILLGVTAAGIVGLTSFWVGQRRHQIGIRRALGARRVDILRYFQTENLLIAGGGAIVGTVLALALNLVLIQRFEMARMPLSYLWLGVIAVLLLGQIAVFVPARRASMVPPVVATRSV